MSLSTPKYHFWVDLEDEKKKKKNEEMKKRSFLVNLVMRVFETSPIISKFKHMLMGFRVTVEDEKNERKFTTKTVYIEISYNNALDAQDIMDKFNLFLNQQPSGKCALQIMSIVEHYRHDDSNTPIFKLLETLTPHSLIYGMEHVSNVMKIAYEFGKLQLCANSHEDYLRHALKNITSLLLYTSYQLQHIMDVYFCFHHVEEYPLDIYEILANIRDTLSNDHLPERIAIVHRLTIKPHSFVKLTIETKSVKRFILSETTSFTNLTMLKDSLISFISLEHSEKDIQTCFRILARSITHIERIHDILDKANIEKSKSPFTFNICEFLKTISTPNEKKETVIEDTK